MAEFKLGRIRFVWKNVWTTGTVYYKDDVIQYGGRLYICVTGHTAAADFYTDLDITPSKWNLVSDGQNWKGDWATSTKYVYNDIVKYGARLYIANTVHTSAATADDGLENDLSKWDVFGEGLDYKGDWAVSTRYKVNDFVKYGGINYVCNALHTSAADASSGLEANISNWDEFDAGTEFKGAWAVSTRYKKNDIVRFGGNLHICATYHTSTDNFDTDESNWTLFVQGIQYENEWDFNKQYQQGDIVLYGGNQYISKQTHGNQTPGDNTAYWELYSKGLNWKGDYGEDSSTQEYRPGDIVKVNGTTYICIDETIGNEPPNASYWEEFSSGFNWRDEWIDDREYKKGDVVRYNTNSYVCVLAHQSEGDDYSSLGGEENSRPDLDTTGTYWNIMTVGTETSVLTTKGDMVFYGGSGPARLPIGKEGQVLRVSNSDTPEWAYLGFTDDVFYVSENGVDKPWPAAGGSVDNPFRTIRYACDAVEKGAYNNDAALLLERNRFFIQRETGEWTDYQIANDLAPFTSAFDYNQGKCERDVGRIIDAVVWDLRHSGNVKSREAALKYVNEPGAFYTLGQGEETVASVNYALTVMEKVLAQSDPTTNYQTENGDNSTAIVAQYKNSALTEEGVTTKVTSLVKIVTDAITAQKDDDIPPKDDPTFLIRVATGRYKEILPIIVPANTCIMGDELRATNVQPKTTTNGANLTSRDDTPFSFQAVTHMENMLGDIVLGSAVTPTTGNTEDQSTLWPYAVGSQQTAVKQLARVIRRRIDWHIGDKLENELQGINQFSAALTGYARDQILSNKAYLQAEIIAYIAEAYPNIKYSKTKCKQDVGYILDALAYDLTYGGNWQSVNAGEAYWQGTNLQIDSSEKTGTLAAYERLKVLLQTILRGFTVTDGDQDAIDQVLGEGGGAADVTTVDGLMDNIIDIITNGSNRVAIVYPTTSGALPQRVVASNDLNNAASTIKSQVTSFVSANFPNLDYNSAKCERDVGYIIDAIRYDLMMGTNFASMVVAYSYLREPSKKVTGDQKEATLASYEYLRTLCKDNSGNGDGAGEMDNQIDTTIDWTNDMIFSGAAEGGNEHWWEPNLDHAVQQIELNKDFIAEEVHAHITEYFKDNVIATTSSGNTLTVIDTSWMRQWMKVSLEGTALGGLSTSTTYYVRNILDANTVTLSTSKGGAAVSVTDDSGDSSSLTIKAAYTYSKADCTRDIKAYLAAIQWDFVYPHNWDRDYTNSVTVYLTGCYKTRLAARYYANAVLGSQEEDFYYLRNNTGLRLQTMDGLKGDLLAPNQYGTSRVSAGAYASLDPGWGPKDERVWIKTRSPYVQNCTTFGFAAIGQKIDGALHDGGNDSMVSNDFTQVISDGIGAWLLNNGRAEMVSVFTYYSHIGYLCESGGRARATNGNNSYGDFGSVAEGVDPDEAAVTAVVDNKFQYVATMSNSETDGDQVLNVEFSHAGEQYTEAAINIFGGGTGAATEVDEFRDGAVSQVRMLDQNDSSGQLGGKGYLVVQNTAQAGTTTQLTLAATDGNLSTAYPGMLLIVTGGSGVGQRGIINTYDAGSKVATVTRQSDGVAGWDSFLPGKTIVAPNSSSTYRIEPAISFSTVSPSSNGRAFASTANWSDIHFADLSRQYTDVDVSDGSSTTATFDVDRVRSRYFVTLNEPGLGYNRGDVLTILGSTVGGADSTNDITITISAVNSTTGAIVAFDYKGFARQGIYLATVDSAATFNYSYDGTTWTAGTLPGTAPDGPTEVASGVTDDGSSDYKQSVIVVAGQSSVSNQLWRSTDGVNWTSEAAPGGPYSSAPHITYGNNLFVVIFEGTRDVIYSSDGGDNWTRTEDALPSTGYTAITYGRNKFMAVKSGSTEAAISSDGITWTTITMPSSATWTSITYGQNRHLAVAVDGTSAFSIDDGTNWSSVTLPTGTDYSDVAYGQGNFVATRTGSSTYAYSTHGLVWDTGTAQISSASGIDAVTFGNNQAAPRFFAATAGSTAIASEIFRPARAFGRAGVANEKVFEIRMLEPGSGYDASNPPTITITDPNNTFEAPTLTRVFDGALGQPTFTNRGSSYENSSAEIDKNASNGFADFLQTGKNIAVRRLSKKPVNGSNVVFSALPEDTFKLVNTVSFVGDTDGTYTAFLNISPDMEVDEAVADETEVTIRIRYSQVRLTGHDFLDIGTGNFTETNYPGLPTQDPIQANETKSSNGGRVFFTATDQDGNFRVGDLFSVEQATGVATLNAEAFNIAGLQELSLGEVTLGGNSASISEFSTDPFFTANSDTIVPTQRAIKSYIEAQIGGGGASLNVNSVTAGSILIRTNEITTVDDSVININANMNFKKGVIGLPIAFNYFLR